MRRDVFILLSVAFFAILTIDAFSQEENIKEHRPAPIPIELFAGTNGWTYQMVVDKKFSGTNKLGIFGLSYLRANYDNDAYLQESLNLALLKYDIYKGFSVLSGALYSSHWGFRPYAGLQYAYHSRSFMALVNSGFHLTGPRNFETIAMAEYRPQIRGNWSLYTRVQGMYSQNTKIGEHDRSYIYGRLGVSYKSYSAGCAINFDRYGFGAMMIEDHQLGMFISALL